ncbi:MAG: regulatory protein LuxR [Chloroflexi bacterium OLB15]|nr:MAG: regulatory protein LuxR [Chloroflexi bacterium OLB15]
MTAAQGVTETPHISGVISRERLMGKLALANEHKLTLICAPPGYGKTTLAAQFAEQHGNNAVWHTVEERERDFPSFFLQLIAALQSRFPALEISSSKISLEPGESAAAVASYLRTVLSDDLYLILDDVQHLIGSGRCEAWLQNFINLLPVRCHLVLVSRVLPPLPLVQMVARREVLAIGQDELCFTSDEIAELAASTFGSSPTPETQELVDHLEGWPAGVVLALQPLPSDVARMFFGTNDAPDVLFDTLATMMLDAQPPGLRDFLLASSTLTRITPELVTQVLGIRNASSWIADAVDKNLFLSRVSGGLMYHNLFRSYLQREFQKRSPKRYFALHRQAADWYARNNLIEDAFSHYVVAGDPLAAAQVVESSVAALYGQGRIETLLAWCETLTQNEVYNQTLLYYAAAIHVERFEYDVALQELDRAEAIYAEMNDQIHLADVQLWRGRVHLQRGHYLAAIAQADQVLQNGFESDNLNGRALRIIGFAYFRLGKIDLALRYLEDALPLSRSYGDKLSLSNLLQDLQVVYLRLGRMGEAAACLQEVVAILRGLGSSSLLALALNDLGYHYHQHGDYAQSFATFQDGFGVIAPLQNRRIESYLLWSLGDLQRDLGSFQEALLLYNRALEFTANSEPSLRVGILLSSSVLRRWQRNYDEAASLAEEAYTLAEAHGLVLEQNVGRAAYWAAHGYQEDTAQALDELLGLVQELHSKRSNAESAQILAVCADLALQLNDKGAASAHLSYALQLLEQGGSYQPTLAEIVHNAELDKFVLANANRLSALISRLSHLRSNQFGRPVVIRLEDRVSSEYIYNLRVHTLGREKIERDGVPVLPADWRAAAARELFFYLLFEGPKRRETISLDFWPDSSAARVRSNFHTTLYRVRQALGENVIVFNNDTYQINPDIDIWCDAQEFQVMIERAQGLSIRDARTEDLFRRAVDLYQGDFLPQLNGEWIDSYRERLSEAYLDSMVGLGRCAHARRDLPQALRLFKQALKLDPFHEEVHRLIMSCYAERGERQKVYLHLKQMQQLFRDELAVEPTRETIQHARSLLS